jgi:hypothetical protein
MGNDLWREPFISAGKSLYYGRDVIPHALPNFNGNFMKQPWFSGMISYYTRRARPELKSFAVKM